MTLLYMRWMKIAYREAPRGRVRMNESYMQSQNDRSVPLFVLFVYIPRARVFFLK
jgi:hypothetical protein